MASYCKRCGHTLFDGLCKYCGKDHEIRPVEDATSRLKRKIKKHFHLPHISKIIIVVLIVALAVIVSYLLFSKQINSSLYQTSTEEKNQIIQNSVVSGEATQVKEFLNIKPKLSVFHQMVNKFDFEQGCFGRINGGVTNKGTDDALNVIVTCSTQTGVTVQQNIDYIAVGKTEIFELFINYDCAHVQTEECTATCSNCQ